MANLNNQLIIPVVEEDERVELSVEQRLEEFRNRWKDELNEDESAETEENRNRLEEITKEEKAQKLFLQGVAAERIGHLYDAIKFYSQAIKLVPDIESQIQYQSGEFSEECDDSKESDDHDVNNLVVALSALTTDDTKYHCTPERQQTGTHISCLPMELLLYIFRWVVSDELDLRSLEQLSCVCRGFYVCSHDTEIWRLSCQKIWGKSSRLTKDYPNWRRMFISRPHLRFDGIYISKVQYYRFGEAGLDHFYKPFHLVEYFRYLRVFPDGYALMLTTPEELNIVVSKLRTKTTGIKGIQVGKYKMLGDVMTCVMHKENLKVYDSNLKRYIKCKQHNNMNDYNQTFHLEFTVNGSNHKPNTRLEWQRYTCETHYRGSDERNTTEISLDNTFPPMYFTCLKSYLAMSINPL